LPRRGGGGVGCVGLGDAKELIGGVVNPLNRVGDDGRGSGLPALLDEPVSRVVDKRYDATEAIGLTGLVADEIVGVDGLYTEQIDFNEQTVLPAKLRLPSSGHF